MTSGALSTHSHTAKQSRFAVLCQWLAASGPKLRDFFVHVVFQSRILKKAYPGVMHTLLFWGVTLQIISPIINLMQMQLFIPFVELPFPRGNAYLIFELVMDIAGVAILMGVLMAAFRRIVMRPQTLETRWDDLYVLGLLTVLPLVGFTQEGLRLLVYNPPWAAWSPVGFQVSRLLTGIGITPEAAATLHPVFFWTHVSLGLLFFASIPFTKLRHLVFGPLNILLRPNRKQGVLEKIENIDETELLGVGKVTEFTPWQLLSFDACVRCGRCEEVCPATISGMDYSPRVFIQTLRQTMLDNLKAPNGETTEIIGGAVTAETPWYCTTCGACTSRCPAFVNPIDEVVDLRRYMVLTTGKMPKSVGEALRNMERQGNPWGMPGEERGAWMEDLQVRELAPGDETDVLLFVGCAAALDERNKKVLRAFIGLLQQTNVDFGVLGFDEMCCGETARRLGHEYLFQMLAEQNIEAFGKIKFNRIVTQCPHCFNTLKNEYPQFGGDYKVQHYTEYLTEVGLPSRTNGNGTHKSLVFHDSCYLGRYNQIYQQPRQLLSESGNHLVEMKRQGENSFCCGGGGGQMWLETDPNTRINHRRLEDALETGADTIATACPYCLIMLDDAIRSKGAGDRIQVLDIAEILYTEQKS